MSQIAGVEFGITIAQPWCSITVEGPRRFHNLPTRPPSTVLGKRLAIYAAAKPDLEVGWQALERLDADGVSAAKRREWKTRTVRGAVIGTALVVGIVTESDDPWFVGPFALVLGERAPLADPVKVEPGAGGIWRLA